RKPCAVALVASGPRGEAVVGPAIVVALVAQIRGAARIVGEILLPRLSEQSMQSGDGLLGLGRAGRCTQYQGNDGDKQPDVQRVHGRASPRVCESRPIITHPRRGMSRGGACAACTAMLRWLHPSQGAAGESRKTAEGATARKRSGKGTAR